LKSPKKTDHKRSLTNICIDELLNDGSWVTIKPNTFIYQLNWLTCVDARIGIVLTKNMGGNTMRRSENVSEQSSRSLSRSPVIFAYKHKTKTSRKNGGHQDMGQAEGSRDT
jgi:hypothetical protein